ncbi:MAG: protein-disulfide reductase DsbD domain-containing protein [Actinomycetota bacterium]
MRAFLDGPHLVPGLVRDLVIELSVPEGQHLYGEPVPAGLVPTHVTFDEEDGLVVKATEFPPTTPHRLATGEELHVFEGAVVLRTPITVLGGHGRGLDGTESTLGLGPRVVRATVHFQSCDDHACGLPERVPFEVPVTVEPAIIGDFGGPSMRGKKMHGGRHMRRLLARRDSDHETDEENRA